MLNSISSCSRVDARPEAYTWGLKPTLVAHKVPSFEPALICWAKPEEPKRILSQRRCAHALEAALPAGKPDVAAWAVYS